MHWVVLNEHCKKKELEREFQFCFSNSSLVVSPRFFIGTNKTDLYSDMTIRLPTTRITQSTIAHTHTTLVPPEPDLCAKISWCGGRS